MSLFTLYLEHLPTSLEELASAPSEELLSASLETSPFRTSKSCARTVSSSALISWVEPKNVCHFLSPRGISPFVALQTPPEVSVLADCFFTPESVGCDAAFLLAVELPELSLLGRDFMVSKRVLRLLK